MRSLAAGRAAGCAIIAVAVILGCSGDETRSADFSIAFDPPRVDAYVTANKASEIALHATLSPRPTALVIPTITTRQSEFDTQLWAFEETPGRWAVRFTTMPLALGSYAGELTLHLCRDQACAGEYTTTGATLPYTLTVLPPMTLSVRVGDVTLVPGSYSGQPYYTIASGVAMTITSNVPIARFELGSHTIGSVTLTDVSRTETSWTVIPTGSYDTFGILVVAVTGEPAQIFFSFQ